MPGPCARHDRGFIGPLPLTTDQNSPQSISPKSKCPRSSFHFSSGSGSADPDSRLGNGHVDELLAQIVVGDALYLPLHRLLGVRGIGVVGPNIISDGHHHRSRSPEPWPSARESQSRANQALITLSLVERLLLADTHHRPGIRPVGAAGQHHLVGDSRAIDQPADGADVGPAQCGVVEDRRVLVLPLVEQGLQLVAINAQRLGGRVQIEAVARLVLDLAPSGSPCDEGRGDDPIPLRLHADDLGVGVLGDLADQGLPVVLRHPVGGFDLVLGGADDFLEASSRVIG